MNIGILGLGEVGTAIKKVYDTCRTDKFNVFAKDVSYNLFPPEVDVLNVCIPYKDRGTFISMVKAEVSQYNPEVVIIHSTVGVGTTRALDVECKCPVVHSPVRGIHPDIYTGLKTFPKFFGACGDVAIKMVTDHFNEIGLEPWGLDDPETSEALKLWDTTVYGVNIALGKHIKKFCDKVGANYRQVMHVAAMTYNEGFQKMYNQSYRRYDIKDVPGKIGGHCVIPNAEILSKENDDVIAHWLLALNDGY